jgi:hypothetical protein
LTSRPTDTKYGCQTGSAVSPMSICGNRLAVKGERGGGSYRTKGGAVNWAA